jgi:FAD synthase
MLSFSQYLEESKSNLKTAVVTFGRFSPPHTGHDKLVQHVLKQEGDEHHIIVSHSQDTKKNPLSASEKVELMHKAYPDHKDKIYASSTAEPSVFHAATRLHKQGVHHMHLVVGSDRVEDFHTKLNQQNGKFDANGNGFKFKKITVSSAGDRDPDADGVEGMSASKMREAAIAGDHEKFKSGLHKNLHPVAKSIMKKIKDRIEVK